MDGSKRGYANLCVLAACPRRAAGVLVSRKDPSPLPLGRDRDAKTRILSDDFNARHYLLSLYISIYFLNTEIVSRFVYLLKDYNSLSCP